MNKTFFTHSLGCKVNDYETTCVATELISRGYLKVEKAEEADIIILNTCSVTSTADQKSRQHIARYRRLGEAKILVAMGCYTQDHAEIALEKGANIVVGASGRNKIADYIATFEEKHEPIVDVSRSIRSSSYEEFGATAVADKARAYLKIQDGCDNFCSYCYIPFLRGNSRSRDPRSIIEEAMALSAKGYKEIVITGIHIGMYGKDLGDGSYRLPELLESICNKCPTLPRIRLGSLESCEIDDAFLRVYKKYPAICSHLHIPLQSGSKTVLERMKRHYTPEEYLLAIEKARAIRPETSFTADVIVGFPDESEDEFLETMETAKNAGFMEMHVFPFSSRPGTAASRMKDLSPAIKKERDARLRALSDTLGKAYREQFIGKTLPVLWEEYNAETKTLIGLTSNYIKVSISSETDRVGTIESITIK